MGLLAPLYLAGLAALSLPLVLHLIRRTPKGKQVFSSLMFLSPTPPRLTRRSRLDQIFLLLMRLGVLALLALAFTRPFLRESALLSVSDLPRRRIAILVDGSASLRRGDLWQQAIAKVEDELKQVSPQDDVALFRFSDRLETVVGFDRDPSVDEAAAAQLLLTSAREMKPTWSTGDLGLALTTLAGELDASSDVQQSLSEPQIILISDLQKGSRLEALQAYEWPERVRVVSRLLVPAKTSNAAVQLLSTAADEPNAEPRVKVASAADSTVDQFFVRWGTATDTGGSKETDVAVYVPAGESRVVKLPRPEGNAVFDRIILHGDDHEFDNTHYVVPLAKPTVLIPYYGPEKADDPNGLRYYLQIATLDDPYRAIEIVDGTADAPAAVAPTVTVVTARPDDAIADRHLKEVERGGTLLVVAASDGTRDWLPRLLDDIEIPEAAAAKGKREYQLLGEIDFTHPLFVPFANPRYSDFTKIHFWQHRPVRLTEGGASRAVARFDDGTPWLIERPVGKGRILVMTSGWHPDDSQLALSSKFVMFLGGLLDQTLGSARLLAGIPVGTPIPLRADRDGPVVVRTPEGRDVSVPLSEARFTETTVPGIYQGAGMGADVLTFAVNIPAAESDTAPLPVESLEQLGVRLGTVATQTERLGKIRQQRDVELESRQKVWRWLIVGCLLLVMAETWYSGRSAAGSPPSGSASPLPSAEAVT
ncbi:BatA domain-containing protein [Planctomyces sp. SH-PL14]|uniref:BatA domain-containing protein n=1 Tax=Planctomyces sp. SH-PL14 TaxID=1632864 RepID=UPI00078C76E0|nr:BatA domain-containing protein [Planctomyces sp. SH-PL14]AMV21325.1 hypothetical protein VT03_25715 [Planctomyces sp. SH-PL14]